MGKSRTFWHGSRVVNLLNYLNINDCLPPLGCAFRESLLSNKSQVTGFTLSWAKIAQE